MSFHDTFKIEEVKYDKPNIKQPKASEAGILPTHPFRMYFVGASGSGKTNLLLNLLTRDEMYKGYFGSKRTVVMSPTARNLDASYQALELPEANYFPCSPDILDRFFEIAKKAKENKQSEPALIILDDIISNKKFCNSKALKKLLVMGRHYNLSCMILSQAYHRIPKTLRLNFSCIIYFKGSNKEQEVLCEDFAPPGYSKKRFIAKIDYATAEPYSFLFIDLNRSIDRGRYRKNLTYKII